MNKATILWLKLAMCFGVLFVQPGILISQSAVAKPKISKSTLKISIAVRKNVADWFQRNQGKDTCPSIEKLSKKSGRVHGELWLLCKAIEGSYSNFKFDFLNKLLLTTYNTYN